ncbi:MAG TPA: hypothetical protein DDY14_16810, partial [Chromatiaceae bacterium]|nr:hypothetical protein [Chromatiaceae bacterium]
MHPAPLACGALSAFDSTITSSGKPESVKQHFSQPSTAEVQGDFCGETYHLACLLVRLHGRGNSSIERLWAGCRWAEANEHPARVGLFLSGNRLGW